MIREMIDALNAIEPRVWSVLQFVLLLALLAYGGHLYLTGHHEAGSSIVTGSFALLRFEVGGSAKPA